MFKDKNILIIGGNSGIGFFATINLCNKITNSYYIQQFFNGKRGYFEVGLSIK